MLKEDSLLYQVRSILIGTLIFIVIVAGGTYYLQSSLVIYKHYDAYTHWSVVLLGLPVIAGLTKRIAGTCYPVISSILGAFACAAILYPQYKTFWAVPPTTTDAAIYVVIVLGIGFIATQPIKTIFMMAFRLGRYSMPAFNLSKKKQKPASKSKMTHSQRLQSTGHGNTIAMFELLIGITSLALSIFSIFFLGKG